MINLIQIKQQMTPHSAACFFLFVPPLCIGGISAVSLFVLSFVGVST